jgi:hypothetical protein
MIALIKKYVLLGTERLPFDKEAMPLLMKEYFKTVAHNESENLLLQAVTLGVTYDKISLKMAKYRQDSSTVAPLETQPYCSPLATSAWRKLLPKAQKHPFLIQLFLDKLIENQWIVTPDVVVELLELGKSKKNEHLQLKIAQVVGQRGEWATQFNPKWEYILTQDNVKIFEQGKPAERLAAFRRLRRLTPNMARILLIEKWKNETLKDKKSFLEAMSIEFSEEDKPFVKEAKQEINWQEIDPYLSVFQTPKEIEQNIMNHPKLLFITKWDTLPLYFAWSKPFSEFMLQETYQSFQFSYFSQGAALQSWYACLHPEVNVEATPRLSDTHSQKYHWAEYCSKELSKIIELCRNIAQI